ncbi:hypothetical protein MGYG_07750 [Nannizzia gypsea CBS 118893]|uniref:Uncharacterized protein n=1 Tax=Arthroderma gypseum (strain ATCC MYA-4604 / CBS 118893) TaxID=535722 RepID=E4V418_ARTGP|nr:hypothetical protein MGYG_07750 [Nannizzia gypsea CBS 118893]EFR04742.1 hypothetical protein MGYG_07750 [Nannizzia gypsea CBS 118893]
MDNIQELKPRKLWSEKEDNVLRTEVARQAEHGKAKDWRTIAEKLPGRSNKDCRKRWIKLDGPVKKGPWSQEEDQRLHKAVLLHSNVWTEVAQVVGTRHADQCAKRWLHFLSPNLNHGEWSEQEDERLLAAVERGGRNWRKIVDEILQGRSATDAKNRHAILQRNRKNGTGASSDRQRPSFSRRRRNGTTFEISENHDTTNWWSTGSMDFMRDILHYNSPACSVGPAIPSGSNFDALLMEQPNQMFGSPPGSTLMHEHPQIYGAPGELSGWHVIPGSHPYQMETNDRDIEIPTGRIPNSFENTSDDNAGIADTFFEALTTMADMEGAGGLYTPSASSHSVDCLPLTREAESAITQDERAQADEEYGEEDDDDHIEGITIEKNEAVLINSAYQGQSMPSIEEILGTVSKENRKSTMILQHMQSDQVGQVLEFLLSSNSSVDVKIISED